MSHRDAWDAGDARCLQLTGEALERHLFLCADCRGRVRLSTAWDTLREEAPGEGAAAADERFLARVRAGIRRDRFRRQRHRLLLAAAALLLFFFAAGASSRGRPVAPASTEEVDASLSAPSALEGLLPE